MKCPNVIKAAIKLAQDKKAVDGKDMWALADALVKDCGLPNSERRPGVNNGSAASLETACNELKARGITYKMSTLAHIRQNALAFPRAKRHADNVSFWGHANAGTPDVLDWVLSTPGLKHYRNRKGLEMVDALVIRDMAKGYRQAQSVKRRRALEAAQEEEKKADTLEKKRKARKKVEELEEMPETGPGGATPEASLMHELATSQAINFELSQIAIDLKEILPRLRALNSLDDVFVANYLEQCEAILTTTQHIENFLRGKSNVRNLAEVKHGA